METIISEVGIFMEKLTINLEENLNYIKGLFKDCADVAYREIEIGVESKIRIVLIFIDSITNKEFISDSTIQALFLVKRSTI